MYGIGEILLVTIGILIAVKINNINESRKEGEELQTIYKSIEHDLIRDTIRLTEMNGNSDFIDSLVQIVFAGKTPSYDTINEDNFMACFSCNSLFSTYDKFTANTAGLAALKEFENKSNVHRDSLTLKILEFYSGRVELMNDLQTKAGDLALENIRSLEKYEWYSDFATGAFNKEAVKYFLTSSEYKNKLTTYHLLNIQNLSSYLKAYKMDARILLEEMEKSK
jgi:hypothetical protein